MKRNFQKLNSEKRFSRDIGLIIFVMNAEFDHNGKRGTDGGGGGTGGGDDDNLDEA
jgi:hypothetical protein